MKNRYLVAKYVQNLSRMEPRNIGIFLSYNDRIYSRFMGERNQSIDLRTVRSIFSHSGSYKEWVEYWRYLLTQEKSQDELFTELQASSNGNYLVIEGESLFLPREVLGSPTSILEYLFRLLVDEFPEQKQSPEQISLTAKCEEIIQKYDLSKTPYFLREPLVELVFDGKRQHIRPSYSWVNGRQIYFQKVSIDSSRPDATQKDVNNTLWMFEKLKISDANRITKAMIKLADREEILSQQNRIEPDEYLKLLSQVSDEVIDVDNDIQVEHAFTELMH